MKSSVASLAFLLAGVVCYGQTVTPASLPDAPQPQFFLQPETQAGAAQRSKRSRVRVWNKKFTLAHAAYLGAIVYDVEMTHQGLAHHKCVEKNRGDPHPGRGELYGKDLGILALSTGFDWFMARYRIPFVPYVLPIAGTEEHVRGGTEWITEGCF